MKSEFEIIDLGTLSYFLSLEFVHTPKGISLHKKKYTCEALKRLNMENYINATPTPIIANMKLIEELDKKK